MMNKVQNERIPDNHMLQEVRPCIPHRLCCEHIPKPARIFVEYLQITERDFNTIQRMGNQQN